MIVVDSIVRREVIESLRRAWVGRAVRGSCACRPVRVGGQAGAAISVVKRRRLNAALAKMTSQSTFRRPRSLTLRSQPTVLSQPKAGSMRGRAC